MGRCCVPGCSHESSSGPLQTFHRFPRDSVLAHKWLQIIQNPKINPKSAMICSFHFSRHSYQRDLRNEVFGRAIKNTTKLLLPTALPNPNLCLPQQKSDLLDEQEIQIPVRPVLKIQPEEFKFINYLDNYYTSTTNTMVKQAEPCFHDGLRIRTMVSRALEFHTDGPSVSCETIQSYIENTFSVRIDCTKNALKKLIQEIIVQKERIEDKFEFERMIKKVLTTKEDSPVTISKIEQFMKRGGRQWSKWTPLSSRIKNFLNKSVKNGTVLRVQHRGTHLAYRMKSANAKPTKKSSRKKLERIPDPPQDPLESSVQVKVENEKDVFEEIDVIPFSILT